MEAKQIIQLLANAQKTYAGAGGHNKAEMNKLKVKEYKKKLKEMGEEIPEDEYLYKIGIFNGDGTY